MLLYYAELSAGFEAAEEVERLCLALSTRSVTGVVTGLAALHPLAVAVVKARVGGQAVAFLGSAVLSRGFVYTAIINYYNIWNYIGPKNHNSTHSPCGLQTHWGLGVVV